MKKQPYGVSVFRRGWLVLFLLSLAFALPAEAFQRDGILRTGFDRGSAISEFASRVDERVAEIRNERPPSVLRPASSAEETAKARLEAGYGKFPLLFEKNGGQSSPDVAFTVKGSDKTLYFTPEGLTFSLTMPQETGSETPGGENPGGENPVSHRLASRLEGRGRPREEAFRERWTLKLDFVDAARVRPRREKPAETVISYFGPENEHRSGVSTYNSIVYRDLWPGIDLVYDGDANHLKYRFVVRPGADPERIRLAYRGAERLSLDSEGGLEILTAAGVLRDDVPVCWQETENGRVPVNATYALGRSEAGSGALNTSLDYGFHVESSDPTKGSLSTPWC